MIRSTRPKEVGFLQDIDYWPISWGAQQQIAWLCLSPEAARLLEEAWRGCFESPCLAPNLRVSSMENPRRCHCSLLISFQ